MSTDREKIAKIAVSFAELHALEAQRRELMAKMIRGCLARLKSPKLADRKEAIDALGNLADLLEGRNQL